MGHHLAVGVTRGAQFRRAIAEEGGRRVVDAVDAVALDARRHVGVLFGQQGRAVDADGVVVEDGAVAVAAGLDNARARLVGHGCVVGAVAIDAGGGVEVAFGQRFGVDAVHVPLLLRLVTAGAQFRLFDCVFAGRGGFERRMGVVVVFVAVVAFQLLPIVANAVDGGVERIPVD